MKKMSLKEIITMIKQNMQNEDVEVEIIDLPNNKIKHIIIGNKKVFQTKKQASMTTKQFQDHVIQFISNQKSFNEYVIEFIKEQKETNKKQVEFNQYVIEFINEQKEVNKRQEETNKIILQRLDNIEYRLEKIESCPTIQKELNLK